MNLGKQFKDGMLTQNPVLVQVLGMCSTMAITTSFFNGIAMGGPFRRKYRFAGSSGY